MSTTFRIDTGLGVIFTTCKESVSDAEALSYLRAVAQHPDYNPTFKHLIDCTQISEFEISADLTRSVAQKKLFSSRSRCAIVAPQDHIYGMARMSNCNTAVPFRSSAIWRPQRSGWVSMR